MELEAMGRTKAKRKIYLASSWRNTRQPEILRALRSLGHEVYDFRNPAPDNTGFAWSQIDEEWKKWTPESFVYHLYNSQVAWEGYGFDKTAMDWADTCVLLLPSGKSAHLEGGYMAGQGKEVFVLLSEFDFEPELMYLLTSLVCYDTVDLFYNLESEPTYVCKHEG